jgi:pyridoxamine 5'-phosphate oxidase
VLLKDADERGFACSTPTLQPQGATTARRAALHAAVPLAMAARRRAGERAGPRRAGRRLRKADAYFATRPRASQAGAWASLQSQTLDSRETLERRMAEVEARYSGAGIPRPPHWSGFRVDPVRVEFWYGARHRLHERRLHELVDGRWQERLLYP